jgi:DNA-binding NtrC family response regulator
MEEPISVVAANDGSAVVVESIDRKAILREWKRAKKAGIKQSTFAELHGVSQRQLRGWIEAEATQKKRPQGVEAARKKTPQDAAPGDSHPAQQLEHAKLIRQDAEQRASQMERDAAKTALQAVAGNMHRAADLLAMPVSTLKSWTAMRFPELARLCRRRVGRPPSP